MSPSNSTRWCPTPEQLMILEEMYRGGVRTPNASQIQKITAHLSLYGKIEGKNVFYWFQNHKARERQKLRRKLSRQLYQQQMLQEQFHLHHYHHHHHLDHPNSFLSFFNASSPPRPPPPMPHQSLHNSVDYLYQQDGDGAEAASTQMKDFSTWKIDPPSKFEMLPNSMMRKCCDDWEVMMNMKDAAHNSLPCCSSKNRPLKTLQLFPITSSTVKDQKNTMTSNPTS